MKPVELVCKNLGNLTEITFFYSDGSKKILTIETDMRDFGFIPNRHYNITDLYGYGVIDDKEVK